MSLRGRRLTERRHTSHSGIREREGAAKMAFPPGGRSHAEAVSPMVVTTTRTAANGEGGVVERRHVWVAPSRPEGGGGWASSWSCPGCGVYSHQYWTPLYKLVKTGPPKEFDEAVPFATSRCQLCDHILIWYEDRILYPPTTSAEEPHPDLPSHARATYIEAGATLDASPRAAAALLRLALQQLCEELGEKGNLNDAIGRMVKSRGLRPEIQQALDVVRVIGNNAIHPGEIDLTDDRDSAAAMFSLVNAITEDLIARPKQIGSLYARLPDSVRRQIRDRDAEA